MADLAQLDDLAAGCVQKGARPQRTHQRSFKSHFGDARQCPTPLHSDVFGPWDILAGVGGSSWCFPAHI